MADPIAEAFADGPAFIPYIAAGDPGPFDEAPSPDEAVSQTRAYVDALVAGGADVIELGLPHSEPIADGPTIQQASVRALEAGMTPDRFFELVAELPVDLPIVVMTYYNLVYRYGGTAGVEEFVEAAAAAGVDGIIVPDLPVEESDQLCAAAADAGLHVIFIAAPTTTDERLTAIMERGTGYLYVQARLGTTGSQADVSDQTSSSLGRVSDFEAEFGREPLPKAVGFGVSSGDQAADIVAAGADGVIVGSALIDEIAGAGTDRALAERRLEALASELAAGTRRGLTARQSRPERT